MEQVETVEAVELASGEVEFQHGSSNPLAFGIRITCPTKRGVARLETSDAKATSRKLTSVPSIGAPRDKNVLHLRPAEVLNGELDRGAWCLSPDPPFPGEAVVPVAVGCHLRSYSNGHFGPTSTPGANSYLCYHRSSS